MPPGGARRRRGRGPGWPAGWPPDDEVWVAERGRRPVGYARLDASLARRPLRRCPTPPGSGVGSALLDLVKALRPDGFCLWVFETNTPARALLRAGTGWSSSSAPTARPTRSAPRTSGWPGRGRTRWRSCRGLIDEVDDAARRPAGPPGRADPAPCRRTRAARGPRPRPRARRSPRRWPRARPARAPSGWRGSCTPIITESLDAAASSAAAADRQRVRRGP